MQLFAKNKRTIVILLYCLIFAFPRFIGSQTIPTDSEPIKIFGYGPVGALAFLPDGNRLFIASSNFVRLVDIKTSETIRTFIGHSDDINSLSCSADGTKLLTGSDDGTAILWNTATGLRIRTFIGVPERLNYSVVASLSPDGKKAATSSWPFSAGSYDVIIWDTKTGAKIYTFTNIGYFIRDIEFSQAGNRILITSDNLAKVYDLDSYQEIKTFNGHTGYVTTGTFSPDGRKVLTGSWDRTAKLWDIDSGLNIQSFTGHGYYVTSVAFSTDGNYVITGSYDKTVKLWITDTGKEVQTIQVHNGVSCVAIATGGLIAIGLGNQTAIWDFYKGKELGLFGRDTHDFSSIAFSPNGKQVLAGSENGIAILWDLDTEKEIFTLRGHTGTVNAVSFSPDGGKILTGAGYPNDTTAKLWNTDTGKELQNLHGHTDWITSVAFSSSGTLALTASNDMTAKLWDYTTGKELMTYLGHTDHISQAVFSPNGDKILTGSDDNTVKLWETKTGKELKTFSGHSDDVVSVAFFPDGSKILTGSNVIQGEHPPTSNGVGRLWDINTGAALQNYSISGITLFCLALSPHSKFILAGGYRSQPGSNDNRNIRLLDRVSGELIKYYRGHTYVVRSVAFSPDGSKILSGSSDGTVRLWYVNSPPSTPSQDEIIDYLLKRNNNLANGDINGDSILNAADVVKILIQQH